MKIDVIVTGGGAVLAVKRATSVIPIVFAVANDPVGAGYVSSSGAAGRRHRPDDPVPDLAGKRIGLLQEVVPDLRTAILGNVGIPAQ